MDNVNQQCHVHTIINLSLGVFLPWRDYCVCKHSWEECWAGCSWHPQWHQRVAAAGTTPAGGSEGLTDGGAWRKGDFIATLTAWPHEEIATHDKYTVYTRIYMLHNILVSACACSVSMQYCEAWLFRFSPSPSTANPELKELQRTHIIPIPLYIYPYIYITRVTCCCQCIVRLGQLLHPVRISLCPLHQFYKIAYKTTIMGMRGLRSPLLYKGETCMIDDPMQLYYLQSYASHEWELLELLHKTCRCLALYVCSLLSHV